MLNTEDLADDELHLAVRCSDFESAKRALDNGLKPNTIGLFEWSAVHESAYNGDLELLKLLISYGGDCNKKDLLNGSTAVHYAAAEGHPDCLEYLLSIGGDPTIENSKGRTVPQLARHKQCKAVLSKFGIKVTTSVHFEKRASKGSKSTCLRNKKLNESLSGSLPKLVLSEVETKASLPSIHSLSSHSGGYSSSCRSYSSLQSLSSLGSSIEDICAGYITIAFQYNRKTSRLAISISEIVLSCLKSYENAKKDFVITLFVQGCITSPESPDNLLSKSESFRLQMNGTEDSPVQENSGSLESFWSSKSAFLKFIHPLTLDFKPVIHGTIKDQSVQLTICSRQKRSILKSSPHGVPIATMELPLQNAVKRILKERYELQHCSTGPGARVIDPIEQMLSEIVIDAGSVTSDSVIIGMRRPSVLDTERCVSDGDLKTITSESRPSKNYLSPHSTISMPKDFEEFGLQEVRSHSVPSSPQVHIRVPAEAIDSSDGELETVVSN